MLPLPHPPLQLPTCIVHILRIVLLSWGLCIMRGTGREQWFGVANNGTLSALEIAAWQVVASGGGRAELVSWAFILNRVGVFQEYIKLIWYSVAIYGCLPGDDVNTRVIRYLESYCMILLRRSVQLACCKTYMCSIIDRLEENRPIRRANYNSALES